MSNENLNEQESLHADCVQKLVDSGLSFALYRLPDTEIPHLVLMVEGEAEILSSQTEHPSGFIFAPFSEKKNLPALLFAPQITADGWAEITKICKELPQKRVRLNNTRIKNMTRGRIGSSQDYHKTFTQFSSAITSGRFEKLVLARCQTDERCNIRGKEGKSYVKAEQEFPHCMVTLTYSPISGRWLGATPELLLSGNGKEWETMALAGTNIKDTGEWDDKNVQEQDVVARYVAQTLSDMGARFKTAGPYTSMAGKLMHRRTDFTFRLSHPLEPLNIIQKLHPTPAVCGMPKEEACRFILRNEGQERNYYSGYLGPINMDGKSQIFVNLRCAQIRRAETLFYAGGGLNRLSVFDEEAQEIERKIQTLKDIII